MITTKTDGNVVGETASAAFSVWQQGGLNFNLIIKNSGVNVITFEMQGWNGSSWIDLGTIGGPYFSTLQSSQVSAVQINFAQYGQFQLLGSASGGSYLDFSVQMFVNRTSGGSV